MDADAHPLPSRLLRGDTILADALVRDLADTRSVGVLCTHDRGGAIHAVPMWFAFRADAFVLASSSSSRKVANLAQDDRATLVIHDSRPGTEVCGVSLHGRVEIVRGPDATALVDAVHGRYLTQAGEALPAVREFLAYDDVALVLSPERAWTWDERDNPATTALRASGGAFPLEPTDPRS